MDRMNRSLLIIRNLLAHTECLRELLGEQWPTYSSMLMALLSEVEKAGTNAIPPLVNQIIQLFLSSPADQVIRTILRRITEAGDSEKLSQGDREERFLLNDYSIKHIYPAFDRNALTAAIQDLKTAFVSSGVGNTMPEASTAESLPEGERRIGIWFSDGANPLRRDQTYLLNFKIGRAVTASLVSGSATEVPASDVPPGGLATEWVIASRTVELAVGTDGTSVETAIFEGGTIWTARFGLLIPEVGESAVPQMKIVPRTVQDARLDVVLYGHREIYRQFTISLSVADGQKPTPLEVIGIQDEIIHAPAAHLNLRTSHEWATPPGELVVTIIGSMASIRGDVGALFVNDVIPWSGVKAKVAGKIDNVRASAEDFRNEWEDCLNDIDPVDLAARLANWTPAYNWEACEDLADAGHRQRWNEVSVSQELRNLAFDGHRLYEAFFPSNSKLRTWVDLLAPGHRLDISWTLEQDGIPHIPWGLMYLPDVPPEGQAIDPIGFLAQRFRLSYTAHDMQAGSKALGSLEDTHRAHFFYWGDHPQDTTGEESRWQQQQWSAWNNQVFVPALPRGVNPKSELVQLLNEPLPAPTSVLYLFCQCTVGNGNDPELDFGGTVPADLVRRTDLGTKLLADRPLVFANACMTAATDPYIANELEGIFFDRGCRAYLGTETKVPIQLASRFASIFFHFLYGTKNSRKAPLAAGEAVAQTRLFLWTHYRNLGGLFYTYVNQYELFMASDAELRSRAVK